MAPAALIDTGAIVAIVETDDAWHLPCLDALRSVHLPLLTTDAVLTELFHLIPSGKYSLEKAWTFVRSGALTVRGISDPELSQLHELMVRYHDRPMDFTDATLVHLAALESISLILTVDHDDFETYRIGSGKRFNIMPTRTERR